MFITIADMPVISTSVMICGGVERFRKFLVGCDDMNFNYVGVEVLSSEAVWLEGADYGVCKFAISKHVIIRGLQIFLFLLSDTPVRL